MPPALAGNLFSLKRAQSVTSGDPELVTSFQASPTKAISRGRLSLGGHCEVTFGK